MRDVIRVMDVSKSFGEETVLHHISYDFKEGRIYGIVGNNGSGKTVLMKCICGFLIPDSGEITVNYKRIGKDMDFPQDTGIIIETPGFLPNLTGMRNLELLASLRKKIDKKAVAEAKYHPERITEKDIPVQIKTGKAFIHGHDKENRPCVVIKQSLHIPGQTDMEEMIRYGFYILEKAFKLAEQTEKKEIYDLS